MAELGRYIFKNSYNFNVREIYQLTSTHAYFINNRTTLNVIALYDHGLSYKLSVMLAFLKHILYYIKRFEVTATVDRVT